MLTEPQPVTNASETLGEANAATTLAVDIGGSGIKVILLDATGQTLGERARLKTPSPATPDRKSVV